MVFSKQYFIKSVCVIYASECCFDLRAVKSKPSNNARNFEPRDSYNKKDYYKKKRYLELSRLIFAGKSEGHLGRIVKNHDAQV